MQKLSALDCSLSVSSSVIKPAAVVRDLGVLLDSELNMKQHVNQVARTCFYQLHHLRQVLRYAGQDVAMQLVSALILSRLDYCNNVLAGLPKSTLAILQCVQNAAAWSILDHMTTSVTNYVSCTGCHSTIEQGHLIQWAQRAQAQGPSDFFFFEGPRPQLALVVTF